LLLYTSTANAEGLEKLATMAVEKGKNNVAFICYFLLHKLDNCLNLLCETGRIPEAAFLARTYLPSHISRIVKLWKQDLKSVNEKAAESLADPMEYENLFPDIALALKAEKHFMHDKMKPAISFSESKDDILRNLIEEVRSLDLPEEDELVSIVGDILNDNNKRPTPEPLLSKPNQDKLGISDLVVPEDVDEDALARELEAELLG